MNDLVALPRLAILGVAKNCGKTTTLNTLLRLRAADPPGLISLGIDGESEDALLGTQKPPIHLRKGQWIVTTELAISRSSAPLELVRPLGWTTPFGDVIACRALDEGNAILSGIRHRQDLLTSQRVLLDLGAPGVWIDGAYGRISAAHPDLCDGLVLATGAVVGTTIDEILAHTAFFADRLSLPPITDPLHLALLHQAERSDRALFLRHGDTSPNPFPEASALLALRKNAHLLGPDVTALAIPGLISDSVAEELLTLRTPRRALLVPDGTAFHLAPRLFRRLADSWDLFALRAAPILAISYNPSSLAGHRVDDQDLQRALSKKWPSLPVFNSLQ